jgi:hypothetical protein
MRYLNNRFLIVAFSAAVIASTGVWCLYAQIPSGEGGAPRSAAGTSSVADLVRKLEQLSADMASRQQEQDRKLDQILNNQAAIIKELNVIRVRSGR